MIGIHRSARRVRQQVVNYLSEDLDNSEGQPIEYFAGLPWSQDLNNMTQTRTYSDPITLQAVTNLYNIELQKVSSLGNDALTLIQPQEFEPIATFYLGHFAEGGGENYITLDQISSNVVDTDITTESASNTDTVTLDVATDDADNYEAVDLGADNDNTVGLNVAAKDAVGSDVAADDVVGLDLAADGANNDGSAYLNLLINPS